MYYANNLGILNVITGPFFAVPQRVPERSSHCVLFLDGECSWPWPTHRPITAFTGEMRWMAVPWSLETLAVVEEYNFVLSWHTQEQPQPTGKWFLSPPVPLMGSWAVGVLVNLFAKQRRWPSTWGMSVYLSLVRKEFFLEILSSGAAEWDLGVCWMLWWALII